MVYTNVTCEKYFPLNTSKNLPKNRLNTRINTRVFVALISSILKRKEEKPVVHIHIYIMALFSSEDDESENRTNPLWKVLQKSFVSYKKLQFSKRMYAMKNALFSRRIHDESNRGVRNTVVMILGERMNAFDRLISRVDAFFFSSYVSEFPPIESKKMFLFTNNTNTDMNTKETTTMKMKSIDFVANQVGGYTTDCGWGCTLRSAQMLFGEALMRSARARRFRRRRRSEEDRSEEEEEGEGFRRKKEIVDMFSDDNDDDDESEDKKEKKKKNVFALRRVYEGDEDENALCPGQWMAPSEICKRYGKMMNRLDSSSALSSSSKIVQNVRCLILGDGCGGGVPEFYPERVREEMKTHADKDVLILVPLRCGASDAINPEYVKLLQKFLSVRECVGIVGGKKTASYYIVGFTSGKKSSDSYSEGEKEDEEEEDEDEEEEEEETRAIYLDPHVAKAYVSPRERSRDESTESAYYRSFFGSASEHGILYTPFHALDPSLVVGFLVGNDTNYDEMNNASSSSLDAFVDVLTKIERESGSTPLITVVTKKVLSKKKMNSSMNSSSSKRTENNKRGEVEDEDDWEIIDGCEGEEF